MGVVTGALEMTGMLDDTIIIASSDNGGDFSTGASNHPCTNPVSSAILLRFGLL